MKTFKNKLYTKRDYECTNIVYCKANDAPNDNWIECSEVEIDMFKVTPLHTENNVKYFGHM